MSLKEERWGALLAGFRFAVEKVDVIAGAGVRCSGYPLSVCRLPALGVWRRLVCFPSEA